MPTSQKCPTCGAELTLDASGGHCQRCLLQLALAPGEPDPSPAGGAPGSEQPGDRIRRYKLLQQIGEGGCGVVYMAEQEEPVRRHVALKVIKLGMDTKNVIARFEAERQAMALMDHPNIAKVLDAGATESGRPFFVMELVRGIKITEFCDQENLSMRERLDLFVQVCSAIQHAHQKGVIHRDIKPSNILVTLSDGVPMPKVIDFGIAKATQQPLTDKTLFTAFEQFVGTPAYMSPEQAEMNASGVDTRSDIYSLGVLLYELLTGQPPFDAKALRQAGFDEIRRIIREREPERPSTRLSTMMEGELTTTAGHRGTEAPKLIHLVRGDLDWIVMKALEKDRARRYETANGLAADIRRHLDNEPVNARPPSGFYRFQKMVRRNKLAFSAASAVVAALAVGLGVSTWMFTREREGRLVQTRLRGEAEIARANEVRLRQKLEVRMQIVQARALYDAKKYEEAENLLNETDSAFLGPDSAHASLRRGLTWRHILRNQWDGAVTNLAMLLQADGPDMDREIAQDHYFFANALVEIGDRAAYERFRQALVARHAGNTSPEFAKFLCEITLLMSADEKLIASLGGFYDLAATRLNYAEGGNQDNEVVRRFSLALVDYRRGNYAQAAARCASCLSQPLKDSSHLPAVLAVSAMARHQLRQKDEARLELAFARQIIDPVFQTGPSAFNQRLMGVWMEWVEARTLLREAANLIGELPSTVSPTLADARAKLDKIETVGKDKTFWDAAPAEYDEAARLINEVPALALQVDGKRTGAVFAALGWWRLQRHQWREAAAQWSVLVYGPGDRGSLMTGQDLSSFYLSFAPLIVELEDVAGYEKFRAQAIATFGGTAVPANAERTLAVCLLLPAHTNQMDALGNMARVIASAKPPSPVEPPWGSLALALLEYRRGNHARSLELIRNHWNSTNQPPTFSARSHVLAAMACYRLNQPDEARSELAQCRETIEAEFKAEMNAGKNGSGKWCEWWFNHILLREAITLVEGQTATVKEQKQEPH